MLRPFVYICPKCNECWVWFLHLSKICTSVLLSIIKVQTQYNSLKYHFTNSATPINSKSFLHYKTYDLIYTWKESIIICRFPCTSNNLFLGIRCIIMANINYSCILFFMPSERIENAIVVICIKHGQALGENYRCMHL